VPTLVEKRGGGIIYGLKQDDLCWKTTASAEIRVQEEMDTAPVSLWLRWSREA